LGEGRASGGCGSALGVRLLPDEFQIAHLDDADHIQFLQQAITRGESVSPAKDVPSSHLTIQIKPKQLK
jgi:hypothetical protein